MKRLIVFAFALAAAAYAIGSLISWSSPGFWIPYAFERASVASLRLPPAVRLLPQEIALRDQRLKAVFGNAIPETQPLWSLFGGSRNPEARDPERCLANRQRLADLIPYDACDTIRVRPATKVLLDESDPKTETVFVRPGVAAGALFFFLGRDGSAKILIAEPVVGSTEEVFLLRTSRRFIRFRVADKKYPSAWIGDDPGPEETTALSFHHAWGKGQSTRPLKTVPIDHNLAQRFRYYAAIQGKPYDPADWIPPPPKR